MVILLTDGKSNINPEMTLPEARSLKLTGTTILTIAIGFEATSRELQGLASEPVSENLIFVDDFGALNKVQAAIVRPICTGEAIVGHVTIQYR